MANAARPRPDMPAPQPVEATKVSESSSKGRRGGAFVRIRRRSRGPNFQVRDAAVRSGGAGDSGLDRLRTDAALGALLARLWIRSFLPGSDWDPVNEQFGALPFIYGTLVSSLLALIIAVPLSIGVAVFTTEMCPPALRGPLSFFVELLAAIPSVIYGLWAIFVLVPILSGYVEPFLSNDAGLDGIVYRAALWHRHAGGGNDSRDHDRARLFRRSRGKC